MTNVNRTKNNFDLDNNGQNDPVECGPTAKAVIDKKGGTTHADGFLIDPAIQAGRKLIHFDRAPDGIGLIRGNKFQFTKPNVPFHAALGLASFTAGQMAGSVVDAQGKVKPFHIKGLVIGLNQISLNPEMPKMCFPMFNRNRKVEHYAYEQEDKGPITQKMSTNDLTWVIKVGADNERLDPNRIALVNKNTHLKGFEEVAKKITGQDKGKTKLTTAEELIANLLSDANNLHKENPNKQEKTAIALQIKKLCSLWQRTHPKSDDRVRQITSPILWKEIQCAMAKLAGLTPADLQ